MIYILLGNDTKNKSNRINELTRERESFFVNSKDLNDNIIMSYATNISLFGETPAVILEEVLKEENFTLSVEAWLSLKESKTIFIFKEDKLSVLDQKKYKKYGEVSIFENKKSVLPPKFNVFDITDAYANRDKITAWALYCKGIESGVEPEAIAGILFWKIKTMLLNGTRSFNQEELKHHSSRIVSIYHHAHRGELDFPTSLEQFILASLSSR